jgi:hypothetical protein
MKSDLQALLAPILDVLDKMDPDDASAADALNRQFPVDGEDMKKVAALFAEGLKAGWLCDREAGGVRFSRVAKEQGASAFTIDAVAMNAPGPGHVHPNGEFDLCFAVEGDPRFDDKPPGWTVYGKGSWHVPTVSGGAMHILYFLPGGAIEFGDKPAS